MTRWVMAAALLLGVVQAPPVATGLIAGRVIDSIRNAPLTGAVVSLTGGGQPTRRVLVDPQGRYFFSELPAGSYAIAATKAGYLAGAYGKRRPDGAGRALDLRDAERVVDAAITMWRGASITGTVVDDVDDPVSGAGVQVMRRTMVAGQWRLVTTGVTARADERGVYRVANLVPGEYALVITSLISAMPISFAQLADATRRMDGATAAELQRQLQTNGSASLANDAIQGFATTRVGDMLLQSGAMTSIDERSVSVYPTVWYPSASSPSQATRLTVGPGDNLMGIDIRTNLSPTVRMSGVVSGPDGPIPYLSLKLLPATIEEVSAEVLSSLSLSFTAAMTVSDSTGAFTFAAVPPGQYIVRALTTPPVPRPEPAPTVTLRSADGLTSSVPGAPQPPPMVTQEPTLWTATPVSVADQDVTGVTVTMRPGLRVTGRVEFEGTAPKPTPAELRTLKVLMDPADGRAVALPAAYQAQFDPNGAFYTIGLVAGRYYLRLDAGPRGWTLKSAIVGGRDICDSPVALESRDVDGLVLTFTDRPAGLVGTVRGSQGAPDENADVLVFPADGVWTDLGSSPRRLRSVRPSRSGSYAISGLPAGEYFVVAVDDALVGAWQDPVFLRRLAAVANRVTVIDGQSKGMDLVTTGVR